MTLGTKLVDFISGLLKLDTPLKRVIRRGIVVAIFAALAAFGNEFVTGNVTLDPLVVAIITAILASLDKARREYLG